MTEAIYLEVSEKTESAKKEKRHVSVSGMLRFLGVSWSGYYAWLNRVTSDRKNGRRLSEPKFRIYDKSKQNYSAHKIGIELRKDGEIISDCTVGSYMKELGIKVQWIKPWIITTKDSDFSSELQNLLNENLIQTNQILYGAAILLIFGR